jgi:hypothetical protein
MARKALMLVVLFCACGSDTPANVAGTYTMSLTVQQNQCGILTNPSGSSSTGVSVNVTQSGSEVSAQVQGVSGVALSLATGTSTFTGTVSGSSVNLSIAGTSAGSSGTCAYTVNAHLVGTLSGDALQGSVTYTYLTNKTADCGTRDTCQDVQLFSGTRPPTPSP